MIGEDLSPFFSTAEFAVDATIDGVAVRGIFDNGYAQTQFGVGMADSNPTLLLPTSVVPENPTAATVQINGVDYAIEAHEPDGTGVSLLRLG